MPVKTCLVHSVMPDDKRVCVSMFIDAADCWQVFELMPEWHARAIEAVSKDIPEPWLEEALDRLPIVCRASVQGQDKPVPDVVDNYAALIDTG